MEGYIETLNPVAKARYLKKLSLLGLRESDDPYIERNSCKFVDHMPSWSQVEYGNIFVNRYPTGMQPS